MSDRDPERAGLPASTIETALEVERPLHEYQWLALHPCLCGGAWQLEIQHLILKEQNDRGLRMTDRLDVRCDTCDRKASFFFVVQYEGTFG